MITSSFKTGAGNLVLEFDVAHTSQAEVADLGTLNYNFDQTPDQLSIDRVQALYTYIQVDLLQYDEGGNDLWDILIDATNEAAVRVTMALEVDAGAFEFFFRLRKSDISLNEEDGIVRLRLTPFFDSTVTVQSVLNDISPKQNFYTNRGGIGDNTLNQRLAIYPCVSVKDFISTGLAKVFGNAFDSLFVSSKAELGDDYTEYIFDDFAEGKKGFGFVEATVDKGLDPAQFDEDELIQGSGSITVTDITDFEFEGRETIEYRMEAVGAGLSVLRRGDRLFVTNGSAIGVQVETVVFSGGQWRAFIEATEPTMIMSRGEQVTVNNWSYLRGNDPALFPAIDIIKDLAGIEGSIFGTGFSRNFYTHRLTIDEIGDNTVTLNYNEAIDFRPFNFDLSIGRSFVGQIANWRAFNPDFFGQWPREGENSGVPNLSEGRTNTNGNRNASKGIEIELAPGYPLLNKGVFADGILDGRDVRGTDNSLEAALTGNGLRSYFQSLNATKESIAVEFSILGATRVLPFNLFQFDSRAPEKYRDKQFRITEARYDFVNNLVKIKGYQISSITTPVVDDPRPVVPPPRTPPPFTGDPIGILIEGVNDEEVTQVKINLFHSVQTGKAMVILNDGERQQGYFQNFEAGQYEVVVDQVESEDVVIATGVKDVPIQPSRINAPAGSFVYKSSPFDDEEQRVTQNRVTAINVELTNVVGNASATAAALFELNTTVSNINGVVTAQSFALIEINSAITNINETTNAQATAIFGLQTCVSTVGNTITAQGSAITQINASIEGLEDNVTATAFALDQTNVFVESVDGKVTNISAKRAIVVGAGDKLAEISLSANDGDGSQGSSEINISADQVRIVGVVFEDANGIIRSAGFTPGSGGTGWRIDGSGNAEFHNVTVWGSLITSAGMVVNPAKIFSATANGIWTGSGTQYSVSWSIGDTVLSTDRIDIQYYRNGVIVGQKTGILPGSSPDTNTVSGGSSGQEIYVVINLVRSNNTMDSLQTRQVPQLI